MNVQILRRLCAWVVMVGVTAGALAIPWYRQTSAFAQPLPAPSTSITEAMLVTDLMLFVFVSCIVVCDHFCVVRRVAVFAAVCTLCNITLLPPHSTSPYARLSGFVDAPTGIRVVWLLAVLDAIDHTTLLMWILVCAQAGRTYAAEAANVSSILTAAAIATGCRPLDTRIRNFLAA